MFSPGAGMRVVDRIIDYTDESTKFAQAADRRIYPMGDVVTLDYMRDFKPPRTPSRVITWYSGNTPLMDVILTRTVSARYYSDHGLPVLYFRFRGSEATQLTAYTDRRNTSTIGRPGRIISMRHSSRESIQMRIAYKAIGYYHPLLIISNVACIPYAPFKFRPDICGQLAYIPPDNDY